MLEKIVVPSTLEPKTIRRDAQARWDAEHLHKWQCSVSDDVENILTSLCQRAGVSRYRLVKHLLLEAAEHEIYFQLANAAAATKESRDALRAVFGPNRRTARNTIREGGGYHGRSDHSSGGSPGTHGQNSNF